MSNRVREREPRFKTLRAYAYMMCVYVYVIKVGAT